MRSTYPVNSNVKNVTTDFCTRKNLSELLKTPAATGYNGIFGTNNFARLQIHFETIEKHETEPALYHITGASRHKNIVTPFTGTIKITEVLKHRGDYYYVTAMHKDPSELEHIKKNYYEIRAQFEFFEDKDIKHSGIFKGELYFKIHLLTDKKKLVNDLYDYLQSSYSNFTYNGKFKGYNSDEEVTVIWGDGRLPLPEGVDIGTSEFEIAEPYRANGWQTNNEGELKDNPLHWWKKVL